MTKKRLLKIKNTFDSVRLELIEELKEINKEKSFREMGEILGTNHAHLNRIITGKQDASIEKLIEYVDGLKGFNILLDEEMEMWDRATDESIAEADL